MAPINRREVLKRTGALAGAPVLVSTTARGQEQRSEGARIAKNFFESESDFFSTTYAEPYSTYEPDTRGDLWPSCWADDGNIYAANGDGPGFGNNWGNIAMNRVYGTPETGITGEQIAIEEEIAPVWGDPSEYRQKPTGMVAVDSDDDGQDELYVAVQDLRAGVASVPPFDDAPRAGIAKSEDYGETWQATDGPMFTDYTFTDIFFLDYGQSYEHVEILGPEATDYVYAYGMDYDWNGSFFDIVKDPVNLYFARVPKQSIQDRSTWEFFTGTTGNGDPTWDSDITQREPVLHDPRRIYKNEQGGSECRHSMPAERGVTVIGQGSVLYNAPLERYIYSSWTRYSLEFYEAPNPWGPWELCFRKDFGGGEWFKEPNDGKHGGWAATIPYKFISDDGKRMWVNTSGGGAYNFGLRRFEVEPYTETSPSNDPNETKNLALEEGATPETTSAHRGNLQYLNDGTIEHSESSYDCDRKPLHFWGYTWPREYNLDRVVYTTGEMSTGGGWFKEADYGLNVQVRQNHEWVEVDNLSISPEYPYDDTAGPNNTYTLTFDDTWGDGVRIIGRPGGNKMFTTISELAVYYDSNDSSGRGPPEDTPGRGPPENIPRGPPDDTPGRGPPENAPGRGPNTSPSQVSGLETEAGIGTQGDSAIMTISWEAANDDQGVHYYEVYGSQEPDVEVNEDTFINKVFMLTEFTHQDLWADETWYYKVRAVDENGNIGPASKEVSGTTYPTVRIEGESLYSTIEPKPPENVNFQRYRTSEPSNWAHLLLYAGRGTGNGVVLRDSPGNKVTGTFEVSTSNTYELSATFTEGESYGINVLSVDGESTGQSYDAYDSTTSRSIAAPVSYGQFDLEAGEHTLTMTVTDQNPGSNGYRAGLDFFELTVVGADTESPSQVSNLSGTGELNTIQLSWDAASDNARIETYEVYGSQDSGFEIGSNVRLGETSTTSFSHEGLESTETWYYKVRAGDSSGNVGPVSEQISAATASVGENLALSGTADASSSLSNLPASQAIDGNDDSSDWGQGTGWNDATRGEFPDWLEVNFSNPVDINRVDVFTLDSSRYPASTYGLRDYNIQVLVNGEYQTVAEVRATTTGHVTSTFDSVQTEAIRLLVTDTNDGNYSRVVEFEIYNESR